MTLLPLLLLRTRGMSHGRCLRNNFQTGCSYNTQSIWHASHGRRGGAEADDAYTIVGRHLRASPHLSIKGYWNEANKRQS